MLLYHFIAKFNCHTQSTLKFSDLSGISEAAENPYGEDDNKSPFPVQPQVKRSYAQNVTVWIKASGLQVKRDVTALALLFNKVFGEMGGKFSL